MMTTAIQPLGTTLHQTISLALRTCALRYKVEEVGTGPQRIPKGIMQLDAAQVLIVKDWFHFENPATEQQLPTASP
jgi:hypothetical protein